MGCSWLQGGGPSADLNVKEESEKDGQQNRAEKAEQHAPGYGLAEKEQGKAH